MPVPSLRYIVSYIAQAYGNSNLIGIIKDYSDTGNLTGAFVNRTSGHNPESINMYVMDSLAGNTTASATTPEEKARIDGYLNFGTANRQAGSLVSFSRSGTVTNVTVNAVRQL